MNVQLACKKRKVHAFELTESNVLLLIHTLYLFPLYLFHECPKESKNEKPLLDRTFLQLSFWVRCTIGQLCGSFVHRIVTNRRDAVHQTHGQLKCLSASEGFQSRFTAFGFAAQPVTLLQLGKLKTVSSLSQENKGHQFERFSTQAKFCKKNILGIQRGAFEILISTFLAGLESGQKLMR